MESDKGQREDSALLPGEAVGVVREAPARLEVPETLGQGGRTGASADRKDQSATVTEIRRKDRAALEAEEGSGGGEIPEITIDLGDLGERRLVLDSNAMELIESKTTSRFIEGFKPQKAADVLVFFWGCLQHYEDADEITIEKLGRHLYVYQLGEIFDIMARLAGRVKNSPDVLAPFVPSNPEAIREILKYLNPEYGAKLWDLGCGDGRVLTLAYKDYGMKGVGVEWDSEQVKVARDLIGAMDMNDAIEIREGLIQDHIENDPDFSEADVVFVYLLAHSNIRIAETLRKRLKDGARVVSLVFPFREWEEIVAHSAAGVTSNDTPFYVYTMGEREDVQES